MNHQNRRELRARLAELVALEPSLADDIAEAVEHGLTRNSERALIARRLQTPYDEQED